MAIRIDTGDRALDAMLTDYCALWTNYREDVYICSDRTAGNSGIGEKDACIVFTADTGWLYTAVGRTFMETHSRSICLPCPVSYTALEETLFRLADDTAGDRSKKDVHTGSGMQAVIFSQEKNSITTENTEIVLTPTEYALFSVLYAGRGQVVSRQALVRAVWHDDVTGNRCDVHIASLRRKLTPVFGKGVLTGVRGGGYIFHG